MERNNLAFATEYKDYTQHVAVMISTDRGIFDPQSAVRKRMVEYAKLYKELHIIIFSMKRFSSEEIAPNARIYSTNSLVRWNYVSDACKVGKNIIKNIPADALILVTCQDPFETGLVGKCLASMRASSELMLQIHTELFNPHFAQHSFLNKIRVFMARRTLPHADSIRVVSRKIAESLVDQGYSHEKILIKPIEVNVDVLKNTAPAFELRQKFPQFKKIVLMVCRLESEKNIEMALKAWKIASAQNSDYGLVIVGSGRLSKSLKRLAQRLDLGQKTAFEGWQKDLVPYYKGADLLLVTSWYEGYGMVYKEAQAVGLKVVSTDVGIAREVGAMIADWTPDDIAEKLLQALQ